MASLIMRELDGASLASSFPRVRHFNRASVLDRTGSDGRTIREACDDIGRGTMAPSEDDTTTHEERV